MKKIAVLLSFFIGISLLQSCEEIDQPVLDLSATVKPQIISPSAGTTIVLLEDNAGDSITIEWSPASYGRADLADVNYILQWDIATNNFSNPRDLVNTRSTVYSTTVGSMNQNLLGMDFAPEMEVPLAFRVLAYITRASEHTYAYSEPVSVSFVPFDEFVYVPPIYLLGDATTVGWSNTAALEMYHIADARFGIVETFAAGGGPFFKFISVRGQWAPQWGTNATGTGEGGPLVYRPTESVPDPMAIPKPSEPGDYRIVADTINLVYTVELSTTTLYMIGNATTAGWDNAAPLELTRTKPGVFSIVTTLTAGDDHVFKFLEVPGQWAPQYGLNEGNWFRGSMKRRATESESDPPGIPAPSTTGEYLIEVNLGSRTYSVSAQ
jgi:starch-binding outer membrane protein SusE/F